MTTTKTINDFIEEIIERDLSEGEGLNYLNQRGISISNLEYYREIEKYKAQIDTLAIVEKEMFKLYNNVENNDRINEKIMILKEIIQLAIMRKENKKKVRRRWWNIR
jgi:hypothetical protein